MTGHQYLASLLARETLQAAEVATLQGLRAQIEQGLRQRFGAAPRFYYGGSYGKGTMLRSAYDLDIVMYFPTTERASLHELFWAVHQQLGALHYVVHPRTVALRLPYEGGFHVDLVPGRVQDATYQYATLYKNATPASTLQTSLKVHIDAVRKSGIADVVRVIKLWRLQKRFTFPTFALEIAAASALAGQRKDDLGDATWVVLGYLATNGRTMRFEDPANTNNVVEVGWADREGVVAAAEAARQAKDWSEIVE